MLVHRVMLAPETLLRLKIRTTRTARTPRLEVPGRSLGAARARPPVPRGALDEICAKLGRTWVVASEDLDLSLGLGVMESVDAATDAMTAATDQMEIQQCQGEIVSQPAVGNLEAAIAAARSVDLLI